MKRLITIGITFIFFLAFPHPTYAHAFGVLYNLPVPFWLYLFGSAAALLVSFLMIGYFLTKHDTERPFPSFRFQMSDNSYRIPIIFLKLISVLLFSLTILTGLLGNDSSYLNVNMTLFWIIFVLGLTYLIALFGNLWSLINPWRILAEIFEALSKREIKGFLKYPEKLGYFPALLFYFLFIWIELFGNTTPFSLSLLLLQYTFLTLFGMVIFGRNAWLAYGEFFNIFFRLIGLMGIFGEHNGKLHLRPPFVGIVETKAEHFGLLLFVLFMLASTAYDGIRETTFFLAFYWDSFSMIPYHLFQTLSLLTAPFLFLAIYYLFIFITKLVTKSRLSLQTLALAFALPLIPIAFVYNVAHYYTLLLTQGQEMVRLLSDPFGWGWNLFNTANFAPNLSILDANITWHSQVGFILLGHIAGVYLAHLVALHMFTSRKKALISQLPMLILMMIYTMMGLWILSQPITSGN